MPKTIDDIAKEFLKFQYQNLEHHNKYFKLSQTILNSLAEVNNDTNSIKKHQDKHNLVSLGIVFLAGLVLGVSIDIWKPYAAKVYDKIDTAQKFIPKGQ